MSEEYSAGDVVLSPGEMPSYLARRIEDFQDSFSEKYTFSLQIKDPLESEDQDELDSILSNLGYKSFFNLDVDFSGEVYTRKNNTSGNIDVFSINLNSVDRLNYFSLDNDSQVEEVLTKTFSNDLVYENAFHVGLVAQVLAITAIPFFTPFAVGLLLGQSLALGSASFFAGSLSTVVTNLNVGEGLIFNTTNDNSYIHGFLPLFQTHLIAKGITDLLVVKDRIYHKLITKSPEDTVCLEKALQGMKGFDYSKNKMVF